MAEGRTSTASLSVPEHPGRIKAVGTAEHTSANTVRLIIFQEKHEQLPLDCLKDRPPKPTRAAPFNPQFII